MTSFKHHAELISIMSGLTDSIAFFTRIPVRNVREIGSRSIYYFTLTGLIAALPAAAVFYIAGTVAGGIAASAASISIMLVINGFNHLDGVMDSGDALMASVPREKKIEIIKDRGTGAGAIGAVIAIYLPLFAFLSVLGPLRGFGAVIASEMVSKLTFVFMLYRGRMFVDGLGTLFAGFMENREWKAVAINVIPFAIFIPWFNWTVLISAIAALAITFYMKKRFYSIFGGINGDLMALSGEISRLATVIVFASSLAIPLSGLPSFHI